MAARQNADRWASPRSKLGRAEQHLRAFYDVARAFRRSRTGYTLVPDVEGVTTEHVYRLRMREPIPPDAALIAGDLVHNLRGVLDHLVFALAAPSGPDQKQERQLQFPICDERDEFERQCKRGRLWSVPDPAVEIIRGRQPFEDPSDGLNLCLLRELSDIDKHRRLHFLTTAEPHVGMFPDSYPAHRLVFARGPYEDGSEVFRLVFDEPQPLQPSHPTGGLELALDLPSRRAAERPEAAWIVLGSMHQTVANIYGEITGELRPAIPG